MKIPSLPRRADLIGIGYGAILFVWLALEDQNALAPAVLGAVGAMLFGLRWILMRMGGKPIHTQTAVIGAILWGAAAGAGGAGMAAILMFFKTAWHAHVFPDYPLPMIIEMLGRSPAWAASGALGALAVIVFRLAARKTPPL